MHVEVSPSYGTISAMTEKAAAGPTEDEYRDSLFRLFDQIEVAQEQLAAGVFFPDVGRRSQLDDDNRKTHPLEMANALQTLIWVAIEHQHALAALVRKANFLHNAAPFTLARAAVESAAVAYWMLAPTDSYRQRIRRLVIYQRQDRYDYQRVATLVSDRLGTPVPAELEERRAWIDSIITRNRIEIPAQTTLNMVKVMQSVDLAIDGSTHFETYWRTASGFAHGRQWAVLNALVRTEQVPVRNGVARVRVESTYGRVHWGAATAFELTNRAVERFRDACLPPRR
jgi:hypothetical protein